MSKHDTLENHVKTVYKRTSAELVIFATQPIPVEETMRLLSEAKVPFKVMLGSYKGEYETSFITPFQYLLQVIELGLLDEQECIMTLSNMQQNGKRLADLVYNVHDENGQPTVDGLGFFGPINEEGLPDAWTFDPNSGLYFGTTAITTPAVPEEPVTTEEPVEDSKELSGEN